MHTLLARTLVLIAIGVATLPRNGRRYRPDTWSGVRGAETWHHYKDDNSNVIIKNFKYPKVVHNHFKGRHAVNDHNAKRHSPISLEVVWATTWWPNRVFAFLLVVMEVNCMLVAKFFFGSTTTEMLQFRKELAKALIYNSYLPSYGQSKKIEADKRSPSWSWALHFGKVHEIFGQSCH